MPPSPRQQALTIVLPVRQGSEGELDGMLRGERGAVCEKLERVESLHFGRLVLIPPARADDASRAPPTLLLIESTFEGALERHVAELARELDSEFRLLLRHCDGPAGAEANAAPPRLLARSRIRTSAFFSAYPALSRREIRDGARLRAGFLRWLRSERASLAGKSPLEIVSAARVALVHEFGPSACEAIPTAEVNGLPALREPEARNELRNGAVRRRRPRSDIELSHALGLAPVLVRGAVQDLSDWVSALWHDQRPKAPDPRLLERVAEDDARAPRRALTHVTELKPGRFRRRALARVFRFVDELLAASDADGSLFGTARSHFARWATLGDGRLVFSSHHDGSLEATLGEFVERASFWFGMIWSHTRDFPMSLGPFWGGARDEAPFKRWAQAGRVPTQIDYSAYPALSVNEVRAAAELRGIFARPLDADGARRALELV